MNSFTERRCIHGALLADDCGACANAAARAEIEARSADYLAVNDRVVIGSLTSDAGTKNDPADPAAPSVPVPDAGGAKSCPHGVAVTDECNVCDFCEHQKRYVDPCVQCHRDDLNTTFGSNESGIDNDGFPTTAEGWQQWFKDCDPTTDKPSTTDSKKYAPVAPLKPLCTHTGETPVITINGCDIHAIPLYRSWHKIPPYDLVIDCTGTDGDQIVAGGRYGALKRYLNTDPNTIYLPWRDHGAPPVQFGFWKHLAKLLPKGDKDRNGVCVVTCLGSHGRTGTAIACLLLATNPRMDAFTAVETVRANHCKECVESKAQVDYINRYATEGR